MYQNIQDKAESLKEQLLTWRRDFHRYAEAGWLEMRTASIIAKELTLLGYEVLTGRDVCKADSRMGLPDEAELAAHYEWAVKNGAETGFIEATAGGFTGVIGILRCGEGPTVALRFDIDALGVLESFDAAHKPAAGGYASVIKGVMHACGHDGHAAIGLGTARLLMEIKEQLHGTVKLVFQPAEEGVRGAKSIVDAGHFNDANYALAAHLFPSNRAEGFDMGVIKEGGEGGLATSKFDVVFHGKAAHAGIAPQQGDNAMLAAATAVLNMHTIPRYSDVPTHLNVGKLNAGTNRNVICDKAVLELEVRGKTSEANEYMENYAIRIAQAAAQMHGCTVEIKRMGSAAALESNWLLSKRVLDVCTERLGMKGITLSGLGGGSEDYAYMAECVKNNGGQAAYVGLFTACPASNHNNSFDFDEQALVNGVKLFGGAVFNILT